MDNFYSSPIFGIGRFFQISDEDNTGNNGTTLLLAEFGLVGFTYYFMMMFLSYRAYCRRNKFNPHFPFAILAGMWVLGYSQGLFQKPFFMALCFMFLVRYDKQTSWSKETVKSHIPLLRKQGKLVEKLEQA
jgi:hypothetical protein